MRHVKTCSANLPKLNASRRLKHMGRFVFAPAVRGRGKNPLTSHAVSKVLCCLGLPSAVTLTKAGCEKCLVVIFDRLRNRPL